MKVKNLKYAKVVILLLKSFDATKFALVANDCLLKITKIVVDDWAKYGRKSTFCVKMLSLRLWRKRLLFRLRIHMLVLLIVFLVVGASDDLSRGRSTFMVK